MHLKDENRKNECVEAFTSLKIKHFEIRLLQRVWRFMKFFNFFLNMTDEKKKSSTTSCEDIGICFLFVVVVLGNMEYYFVATGVETCKAVMLLILNVVSLDNAQKINTTGRAQMFQTLHCQIENTK